jgi:hypothetical protein
MFKEIASYDANDAVHIGLFNCYERFAAYLELPLREGLPNATLGWVLIMSH